MHRVQLKEFLAECFSLSGVLKPSEAKYLEFTGELALATGQKAMQVPHLIHLSVFLRSSAFSPNSSFPSNILLLQLLMSILYIGMFPILSCNFLKLLNMQQKYS
jgi:hypothetical protein